MTGNPVGLARVQCSACNWSGRRRYQGQRRDCPKCGSNDVWRMTLTWPSGHRTFPPIGEWVPIEHVGTGEKPRDER